MGIKYQTHPSPTGLIYIAANSEQLLCVAFDANWPRLKALFGSMAQGNNKIIKQTQKQLDEYFAHQRTIFDLPIGFTGTDFQQSAWQALLTIPYGETRSYSEQANSINKPKAVRAIGHANSLNPIGIVVPCHRVINKSGKLAGYAGGLDTKRYLLALENKLFPIEKQNN